MATLFFTIWSSLLAALSTPDPVETAKLDVALLDQSVQLYQMMKRGTCPKDVEAVKAMILPDANLTDPWGTGYSLSCPSPGNALVLSAGPDRAFDTDDDVRSDALE